MNKSDMAYYLGYITLFIMLGVWMLLWAMKVIGFGDAFLLWLLSAGVLLIIISASGAASTMGSANFLLGTGLLLSVFTLIMLALTSNAIGGLIGAAVGIILIGIIGLVLLYRKIRQEA
ncbi:MAG: hypothetical protein Q7J68_03915 [Thermoplasmata archaeon]|nr:hypothetical protein [Thermoplasmata archaeon]